MIARWGVSNLDLKTMKRLDEIDAGERCATNQVLYHLGSRGIVESMAKALAHDEAGLKQDLPPAATPGRFDEAILVSDFLTPLDRVADAVQAIAGRGTHGHLVTIVDPIEETFPFAGQAVLHDPESGGSLDIGDAGAWGDAYRARISAHRDGLSEIARKQGWTLTTHRTDRPASEAALRLLTLVAAARGSG